MSFVKVKQAYCLMSLGVVCVPMFLELQIFLMAANVVCAFWIFISMSASMPPSLLSSGSTLRVTRCSAILFSFKILVLCLSILSPSCAELLFRCELFSPATALLKLCESSYVKASNCVNSIHWIPFLLIVHCSLSCNSVSCQQEQE